MEPGEIQATLGTGDNEKETRENESISTPSMDPLTLHQSKVARLHLQTRVYTRTEHVQEPVPSYEMSILTTNKTSQINIKEKKLKFK